MKIKYLNYVRKEMCGYNFFLVQFMLIFYKKLNIFFEDTELISAKVLQEIFVIEI